MRKVESQMLLAINSRKDWKLDNTRTEVVYFAHGANLIDRTNVYLHDNLIAQICPDHVEVCDCGWQTTTTKSRLNTILRELCGSSGIYQRKHVWYGYTNRTTEFEIEPNEKYIFPRI